MDRLVVAEVNELPKRVVDWWVDRAPEGALARLLDVGSMTETVLDETLPRDLYPSQSWASLGMGVPYEQHGVFWYGDPKPAEFPFYWQSAAAAGRTVGLFGVLHTSPRAEQASGSNYRFVVPDLFGDDATTVPSQLQPMQELSLRLTRSSARVASLRPGVGDISGAMSFARHGVRPSTWSEIGKIAGNVGRRRWNKERLRVAQSLLAADVFERQVRRHDPDLSVVFFNHVASFMHRYWAATFPSDWADGSGYSAEWVDQYADELPYAMTVLDRILGRLTTLAEETGRQLVVASSMGQKADNEVDAGREFQAVIRQPDRFLAAAGLAPGHEVRSSMVPQLTVVATSSDADHVVGSVERFLGDGLRNTMVAEDGGQSVVTFTYGPPAREAEIFVAGEWVAPESVGMSVERIEDHRSGRHCPRGILISNRREEWPEEIDAFAFAPMMLERLQVAPLAHHRTVGVG